MDDPQVVPAEGPFETLDGTAPSDSAPTVLTFSDGFKRSAEERIKLTDFEELDFGEAGNPKSLQDHGVLGVPYQWNANADPRRSSKNGAKGRTYLQNIYGAMPVVFFQPGKPKFLAQSDLDKQDKEAGVAATAKGETKDAADALSQIALKYKSETRLYSFESDYLTYRKYTNQLISITAALMGIKDMASYDIDAMQSNSLFDLQGSSIAFLMDKSSSYSESISNDSGESMLASSLKGAGDMRKEVSFLLGDYAANQMDQQNVNSYNESVEKIQTGGQGIIQNALNMGKQTIASGGNLLLPNLWKENQFNKSYSITMKLVSPYGDKVSIFKNIFLPWIHMMALTMPRQNSMSGYNAPFIIRAYSRGWFNCDLGIIESVDFKKFGESSININGFPTEAEITVTIKDLYPTIMMVLSDSSNNFLLKNNTGLKEYLECMAGVDLTDESPIRSFDAALAAGVSSAKRDFSITNLAINAREQYRKMFGSIK